MRHLDVDPDRVHVIEHGVDHSRFSPPDDEAIDTARAALRLGAEPYFVYVGGFDYRKNVPAIIDGFAAAGISSDALLVLAGSAEDATRNALLDRAEERGVLQRTVWCGRVSDDHLVGLLGGALGFIYPSLSEGFGLQILEAMATGCPVVTSDRSALQEVAADAAILVDPTSPEQLADALVRLSDAATRQQLRRDGLVRAAQFSWQRTASRTLGLYRTAGHDFSI